MEKELIFRRELKRKLIHLCSVLIPVIYFYTTRGFALSVLIPLFFISFLIDFGRRYSPFLKRSMDYIFSDIMRKHESDLTQFNLSGFTYVLLSANLVIIIFPKLIAINSMILLIFGDISAALVGIRYGKHKFLKKSFEGTFAFFAATIIAVLFTPKIAHVPGEFVIAMVSAIVAGLAENVSSGWADDNFTIPFAGGFTLWLLYYIFFHEFNLVLQGVPK